MRSMLGMETHAGHPSGTEVLAVSLQGAAEAIGVSERTIRNLIDDGRLRSIKVNRRRLVPVDALREFLEVGTA